MPKKNPIFIRRDPNYLRRCIEFLKHFARICGLKGNLQKCAVIPIDGNYDINDKLCPELALSWENKFTLLGFHKITKNASRRFMKSAEDGLDTDSHLKAASQLLRPSYSSNLPT